MKNRRNYYRILHVQADAPPAIIRTSYRTLMQKLKLHPDLGGDDWNASLLNEAYAVLSNTQKRAAYDRQHSTGKMASGPQTRKRTTETPQKGRSQFWQPSARNTRSNSVCHFCGTPKPVRFRYGGSHDCTLCASPLQTVVQLRSVANTQRAVHRTPHRAPIVFFTEVDDRTGNSGTISDLSPRGLQFLSAIPLMEAQVLKITSEVLSATARVIYCRPVRNSGRHAVGVEFITLRFHNCAGTFISENA